MASLIAQDAVFPIAMKLIMEMVASVDWQKRHAAFSVIAALGEGCYESYDKYANDIIG